MKDIGAVTDSLGKEIRVALHAETHPSSSFNVFTRTKNSWWTKQKGVSVLNSEQARTWVKEKYTQRGFFKKLVIL